MSLRLIRPTHLESWLEEPGAGATYVRLRVTSRVKPWLSRAWTAAQRISFARFPLWMARPLGERVRS